MAAKKGKDKKAVSPTLTLFSDFEENSKPEPSPSYFTELPMTHPEGTTCAGNDLSASNDSSLPPAGVKLYFRPGLHTEAVKEGLQQALRHECTVVQIDLGCALQVDWDTLSEPLLRHLVKEDLISVQVPNLKVSLIKGKCKGKLLDLIRQQIGNNISICHRKFKTNQFLNTDWLINKITAVGNAAADDTDKDAEKAKDVAIEVLKEVANSDWNNSTLLQSQEFRVALIKAYKMSRKKSRFEKKQKRRFDSFYEDEAEGEDEEDTQNPKKRRRKHPLPALDEISEDSDDSDLGLEQFPTTEQSTLEISPQRDQQKVDNRSISPSQSPDPNPQPNEIPPKTCDPKQQSGNKDAESSQPQASSTSTSPSASTSGGSNLQKGQVVKCYVCRQRFYTASKKRTTPATRHYKRMCIPCAEFNWKKRHQVNDLSGMVAVVTGGRIKIGYHIVLKLLRCGCKVIATTRFPHDAAKMFAQESDYNTWADRLIIYPLDLKNADGIYKFTNYLKRTLDKLDILINNAAQTIHRPIEFYRHLLDYEKLSTQALPEEQQRILMGGINLNTGLSGEDQIGSQTSDLDNATKERGTKHGGMDSSDKEETAPDRKYPTPESRDPVVELPEDFSHNKSNSEVASQNNSSPKITAATSVSPVSGTSQDVAPQIIPPTQMRAVPPMRMSSFERETLFPSGRFDADGQQLDLRRTNTWRTVLDEVPVGELLEVLMVNTVAPFILNKELKELMVKSKEPRKFVVNVSAMEGQFSRQAKTEYHPHTNMAKAALNMMTRTAALSYRQDDIFMTSVDTGWVTDERPFHMARQEERKGFVLPLDSVDGAARVLDPILDGLTSKTEPHYAVFLKDYRPYPW